MLSVIIPTYRNPKYLDLCLSSIFEGQKNKNQIIVVVDGFFEESQLVIEKYTGIDLIVLEENQGMQYALNVGVWQATNEKILIVNDDNVFPFAWDERIESEYDSHTILTINQIEPTGPGMFNFPVVNCGRDVESFNMIAYQQNETELSKRVRTPDGNIFPFLINKRWYMAVGGFDTFYDSPNLCDWDFFAKLQLVENIKYERTHRVHLYHFGSVATKKNAEAHAFINREQFALQQYEYKWGYHPYNGMNNSKIPNNNIKVIRGL